VQQCLALRPILVQTGRLSTVLGRERGHAEYKCHFTFGPRSVAANSEVYVNAKCLSHVMTISMSVLDHYKSSEQVTNIDFTTISEVYRMSQEDRSVFWEVIVSVIPSRKVYMYMCPIPNSFRDRVVSLHSSKIVDKKEILPTVSNTGIYCSSDKVGTVYMCKGWA
jgi:hypothetical protein